MEASKLEIDICSILSAPHGPPQKGKGILKGEESLDTVSFVVGCQLALVFQKSAVPNAVQKGIITVCDVQIHIMAKIPDMVAFKPVLSLCSRISLTLYC